MTGLKKNATENAYKSISKPLYFKNSWRGWGEACPQTPLAAHIFGAQNLPRLVLKSGYGPVQSRFFVLFTYKMILSVESGPQGSHNYNVL